MLLFSKFNIVYCEIMRASILCNSNFVGNKYFTLKFVSLLKVALRKVSSLCPPSKLLYGNLAMTDLCVGIVWWPRTAIRNFLDNSRKFNFCNRLILKLLHFFSIKKILKMYFLFFKDNLFLKRLNSFDF